MQLLLAGRLDVAFGRSEGLGQAFPAKQLVRRLIRLEPLALLLSAEHPLAALEAVPLAALRGTQVDASVGNDSAPEWVDLAGRSARGVRRRAIPQAPARRRAGGDRAAPAQPRTAHPDPGRAAERPSVVFRPLTEPVPLYPWTMAYRRELRHPGLDALQASADRLARSERWLQRPPDAWIPAPDAATFTPAQASPD